MSEQEQETPGQAVAEAVAMAFKVVLMLAIPVGIFMLRFNTVQEAAKELSKTMSEPQGHLTGRVAKVETWEEEENFKEKQGNMTLTLEIKDRTRITFEDGREKVFLGIPKDPVPTDKDITVVWAKYNILLEIVDAEEYKNRPKEKAKDQPEPETPEAPEGGD